MLSPTRCNHWQVDLRSASTILARVEELRGGIEVEAAIPTKDGIRRGQPNTTNNHLENLMKKLGV